MKVAKIYDDAKLPTRKHPTDAGIDLYAYCNDGVNVPPGKAWTFNTGVKVEIPKGYVGLIWPKSRSNFLIGGGVIDSGYQGEILVKIINVTSEYITIHNGEAIAQLLIQPVEILGIEETPLSEIFTEKSARGSTGGIVTQIETITPMKMVGTSEYGYPIFVKDDSEILNKDSSRFDLNFFDDKITDEQDKLNKKFIKGS